MAVLVGWGFMSWAITGTAVALASAEAGSSAPPAAHGYVNDFAGVLSPAGKSQLESLVYSLERETGAEVAVAIVPSTAPETPKMYAVRLFEAWGIGKRGKDNGVLFLVSLAERRVEVEVGYGLEAVLPDGLVGAILDEHVIPYFRRGEIEKGIYEGVEVIAGEIRNAAGTGTGGVRRAPRSGSSFGPFLVVFLPVIILAITVFIGFKTLRPVRRRCPRCGGPLTVEDMVIHRATPAVEGLGMEVAHCPRCGYRAEREYPIPWIEPGNWGEGGGWGGWGGPGPWGGLPGGPRRGGDGPGGFGGGRSGGGGAGRGW